jgi:hypothetical protein
MAKSPRFISIDDNGIRAAKLGEEWAKWVLDILRNLIVVAFLFYAAEKSGKWYMWALAIVGFCSLYMFATAYIGQSQFNFRETTGFGATVLKVILMIVAFIFIAAFSVGSLRAFQAVIKEISVLQGR